MRLRGSYVLLVSAQAVSLALGLWLEARLSRAMVDYRLHQVARGHASFTDGIPDPRARPKRADGREIHPAQAEPAAGARYVAFFLIAMLQATVAYLVLSREHSAASRRETRTFNESLQRQKDLLQTRDAVIFGLASMTEFRDPDTGHHLERIALYSTRLAAALRRRPRYEREISPSFVKLIGVSSALHDIGKVGVEDALLLKAGPLDPAEREAMQKHAALGGECLRGIEMRLGRSNFLEMAREIAVSHHEQWDGGGYPQGLAGEAIPLAARIVAVADVYDALSSKRAYKEALPHEACVKIIRDGAGSRFDPAIIDVFLEIESEFRGIRQSWTAPADPGPASRAGGPIDGAGLAADAAAGTIPSGLPDGPTGSPAPEAGVWAREGSGSLPGSPCDAPNVETATERHGSPCRPPAEGKTANA